MDKKIQELISCGNKILTDYKKSRPEHPEILAWSYCYQEFAKFKGKNPNEKEKDYLALQITAYLASWGMYRGSSFLPEMNYKIHIKTVEILLRSEYSPLWDVFGVPDWTLFQKLYIEIKEHYSEQCSRLRDEKARKKNATQTLITKILMSTLGCTIAYDRYACRALKELKKGQTCNEKSITEIFAFYEEEKSEFEALRVSYDEAFNVKHPPMKILDVCLWGYGEKLDKQDDEERKAKKAAVKGGM